MRSRGSWELEFEDPRQTGAECARKPKGGSAHALSREAGKRGPGRHLCPERNMAISLLLLSFPWPARPGPLRRCWELLLQLRQNWNGLASPQWGP